MRRGLLLLALLPQSLSTAVVRLEDSLGAASSESRVCSEIGIGLLKRGVSSPRLMAVGN